MCGISGEVNFSGGMQEASDTIRAMNATMADRGPDGEGIWTSEYAALGHRRLAVIDPEGGRQPMVMVRDAVGAVAVSHSGEIYNHQELRRELQVRGHDFRTRSDTEVVLKGYMEFGEGVAEKLRGMFAIAIWDERVGADKLTLMRDHFGIKPLCYQPTPNGVIFASEPKAVLGHPAADRSVGVPEWQEYFAIIKRPGRLVWSGMQEVKPGSVVSVDRNGIRERTYWQLQSRPHTDDYATTLETVRNMLGDIVDEQLVADVPVGMLLSGGLDSSILTALAARSRSGLNSYAVDYTDHETHFRHDMMQASVDAPFAREVATLLHTNHATFVLDSLRLASRKVREQVVMARGLPPALCRDGHASRLLLYKQAKEGSTVVFSGDMADEVFGGYAIFYDPKVLQGNGWSWQLQSPLEYMDEPGMLNREFHNELDLRGYLADTYADAIKSVERLEDESDADYRLRIITYLETTHHIGFLLDTTDRLGGAVGLEVRVPFCDHRLVEYAYNIPWEFRSSENREKGLLRDAFSDMLPSSVLARKKSPYPTTPSPEYSQELQRQVEELLVSPSRAVFDIFSRKWLQRTARKSIDQLTYVEEAGMNQALEMDDWFRLYQPDVTI